MALVFFVSYVVLPLNSPRISLKIRPHHLTSLIKVAKQLLDTPKGPSSAKPFFLVLSGVKENGANIISKKNVFFMA